MFCLSRRAYALVIYVTYTRAYFHWEHLRFDLTTYILFGDIPWHVNYTASNIFDIYNIIACECIPSLCWANTSCVQLFIRNSFCWKRFYLLVRDLWEGMMGQSKWDEKMYSKCSHTFLHLVYVSFKINIERCSTFNENTTNSVRRFSQSLLMISLPVS